jgi:hypothetical protein
MLEVEELPVIPLEVEVEVKEDVQPELEIVHHHQTEVLGVMVAMGVEVDLLD